MPIIEEKDKKSVLEEKISKEILEKGPEKGPEQISRIKREEIEIPEVIPIEPEKQDVMTGTIISQELDGYYQVQVGERQLRIKIAVSETLFVF
ncbi:unnamed protein product, partial [marine sediment metagenome]